MAEYIIEFIIAMVIIWMAIVVLKYIIKIMALNPECDRIKVVSCSEWVVHIDKLDYDPEDEKYVLCVENGIVIA